MTTLYGIKNCDTVKKARKWLAERNIEFIFHDVRADGLELTQINRWIEKADWETVLNRRGTTWRKLDVTRERIRQIEAKALRKLRHPSRSSHLKSFLDE